MITVHPDRIFFEAFSQDQSAYGMVIVDTSIFESAGEVRHGTTNVDFTQMLHSALGMMRSSRETWFNIGPQGFGVETGTVEQAHFEEKVELPESWVIGDSDRDVDLARRAGCRGAVLIRAGAGPQPDADPPLAPDFQAAVEILLAATR